MTSTLDFRIELECKVRKQLHLQRVGYLLGAGASWLDGKGYPLARVLWGRIRECVESTQQGAIQAQLDQGADGLEHALDLLDRGAPSDSQYRHAVTEAIAAHFAKLTPPLEAHAEFLRGLSRRREAGVPIFCLNYDALLERAADLAEVRLVDGFLGAEQAFFDSAVFQERIAVTHRGRTARNQAQLKVGLIHLFKLHGSLGWCELGTNQVRRVGYGLELPKGAKRLMVPPQWRKATDTTAPPYAALWSEFRRLLCHGPSLINRLVCVGYGMCDEHVNAVIDNALPRTDLTLIVLARSLRDDVFDRWSPKSNVILVTRDRCSLYSEVGPGHADLWSFARLSREV